MNKREKLELNNSGTEVIIKMAEGNPGGLSVLMQLMKKDSMACFGVMLDLDDMNIRGTQIWIGFKDHCKSDIDEFFKAVRARDEGMVNTINEEGKLGNHSEIAVTSGASFRK